MITLHERYQDRQADANMKREYSQTLYLAKMVDKENKWLTSLKDESLTCICRILKLTRRIGRYIEHMI